MSKISSGRSSRSIAFDRLAIVVVLVMALTLSCYATPVPEQVLEKRHDYLLVGAGFTGLTGTVAAICSGKLPVPPQFTTYGCAAGLAIELIAGVATIIKGLVGKRDLQYEWHTPARTVQELKFEFLAQNRTSPMHIATKSAEGKDHIHLLYAHNPTMNRHRLSVKPVSSSSSSSLGKRQDEQQDSYDGLTMSYDWDDDNFDDARIAGNAPSHLQQAAYDHYNTDQYNNQQFQECMAIEVDGTVATGGQVIMSTNSDPYTQPGQEAGAAASCNDQFPH